MNVMLDLETMGNGPQAAIVAIGAVEFSLETSELGGEFYMPISLASSMQAGGVVDASTVEWWLRQSDAARMLFQEPGHSLAYVLQAFAEWLGQRGGYDDACVWGNGATFDNVILTSAYRNLNAPLPWPHWGNRCYRTVKAMYPNVPFTRAGVHHNALDDAKSQALHLLAIMKARDAQRVE